MMDRIISLVAFASFALFMGVLAWWVPHPDLLIVLALGLGLCAYDFWRAARMDDDGE